MILSRKKNSLNFYRRNWYYVGGILFVLLAYLMGFWGADHLAPVQIILVYSFMAMLAHQFEEYAAPGGFPGIGNIAVFGERRNPDRYRARAARHLVQQIPRTSL
ncbi:hypothetical protein [Caballeronia sp. M1242]|uniref:hypothetical protein n=1 Tax=Caballeronia sp. M1242 TaxID=2814653 RepID=UPI0019CFD1BF|nr:hypothetical protein [Caballeronia sp. M1242]QSN64333.1 hypothetical protein JYK05_19810 [Caballeronia sp. M1242]